MRVIAILQARMGSSRLPGKVLAEIEGRAMLAHVLERASRIGPVDEVMVATSAEEKDDPIEELVSGLEEVGLFRGSEHDVLGRYHGAARAAGAEAVVRITADCPLLCPSVSTRVVEAFLAATPDVDYASNILNRYYPRGLDTEVFTFAALDHACRKATETLDREHVTPFIWSRPETFRLLSVFPDDGPSRADLRWTVDTSEDLRLVRQVYAELYGSDPTFDYPELLEAFDRHPEWPLINRDVEQVAVGP